MDFTIASWLKEQDWKPFQSYAAGLGYKPNNAQYCSAMLSIAQLCSAMLRNAVILKKFEMSRMGLKAVTRAAASYAWQLKIYIGVTF